MHVTADDSLDPQGFADGALALTPEVVDCKLSNGTATNCYRIVTTGAPADTTVGPFCPRNIDTAATDSGI